MDNDEKMACWLYNVFDKERFSGIMSREGIDLNLDASSQQRVDEIAGLITRRADALSSIESTPFSMNITDDARSFNFARMAAAASKSGLAWLLRKESDLFHARINPSSMQHFLNDIMFGHRVIESARAGDEWLCKNRPVNSTMKVRWERFSDLAADRKHSVRDGWIYAGLADILPEVVKVYRAALEDNITETRKKLQNSPDLKAILEQFAALLDSASGTTAVTIPQNAPVTEIFATSPACMRLLDSKISRGVDIGHTAYLILSFYLKAFMSRDALATYFYNRNPENTRNYATMDDFLRKELDYVFKQMFGEAGGCTNYVSYKCTSIQDERVCPYCDTTRVIETIEALDGDVLGDLRHGARERVLETVRDLCRSGNPKRACGLEWQLRFFTGYVAARMVHGREIDKKKYVSHPVKGYFEDAINVLEKRRQSREPANAAEPPIGASPAPNQ